MASMAVYATVDQVRAGRPRSAPPRGHMLLLPIFIPHAIDPAPPTHHPPQHAHSPGLAILLFLDQVCKVLTDFKRLPNVVPNLVIAAAPFCHVTQFPPFC